MASSENTLSKQIACSFKFQERSADNLEGNSNYMTF